MRYEKEYIKWKFKQFDRRSFKLCEDCPYLREAWEAACEFMEVGHYVCNCGQSFKTHQERTIHFATCKPRSIVKRVYMWLIRQ